LFIPVFTVVLRSIPGRQTHAFDALLPMARGPILPALYLSIARRGTENPVVGVKTPGAAPPAPFQALESGFVHVRRNPAG